MERRQDSVWSFFSDKCPHKMLLRRCAERSSPRFIDQDQPQHHWNGLTPYSTDLDPTHDTSKAFTFQGPWSWTGKQSGNIVLTNVRKRTTTSTYEENTRAHTHTHTRWVCEIMWVSNMKLQNAKPVSNHISCIIHDHSISSIVILLRQGLDGNMNTALRFSLRHCRSHL